MGYVVKMPKLGLEMEQGTVLEWHVGEGDEIEEGDVLLEVESEKSIGEVEAREDGVLRLRAIDEDETVAPGTPIGIVAGEDDDITDLEAEFDASEGTGTDEDEAEATTGTDAASDGRSGTARSTTDDAVANDRGETPDVKASPRARRRAEQVGIDLAGVEGSRPGGAITADDVDAAAGGATAEAGTGAESTASTGTGAATEQVRASPRAKDRAADLDVDITTVEGTGPQGAITAGDVERAVESDAESSSGDDATDRAGSAASGPGATATVTAGRYHTTTLVTDVGEAEALIEATALASEALDLDVAVLDVLLVAVSATLSEYPALNATLTDDTHHCHERQHVALAAGTEQRDVVVTDVAEQSFADLVSARQGQDEDGTARGDGSEGPVTFALAVGDDLGGSLEPPTVAGLAVDASRRRATPIEDGEGVSLDRYLSCSLSYDPRAVGDRGARTFLETVLDSIERAPELLLRTYR